VSLLFTLPFPFALYPFFTRETHFLGDFFVQYNLWWREPLYGAETTTFPRMDESVGNQ
jgi:hypothetical protein